MQHGVRIEAVFASLQQGEHMVESTAVSCIHPDKYNNSVDRIISKEKEREDPRRDSSKTSFQLESKSVSSVSTRNPASYKLILYTELILQEIQENYNNYKAHSVQIVRRHPPATVPPCIQAFYTAESSSKHPYSIQGYLETGRVEGEF